MSALVALLVFVAGIFLMAGVRQLWRRPPLRERLEPYGQFGMSERGVNASVEQFLLAKAEQLGRGAIEREWADPVVVQLRLDAAGNPGRLTPVQFIGLRLLAPLGAVGVALYLLFLNALGLKLGLLPFLALVSPIIAYLAPEWWLKGKIEERQKAVRMALPDMLDLLSVCVQAGMGFDLALQTIALHMEGPLRDEIARFLNEIRMGRPRADALRELASRNPVDELKTFVHALIQAEDLGTPVADTLRHQAADMRVRREQHARELAARASPSISGVTGCLIAPSAFLLLLVALLLGMFGKGGGLAGISLGGP
jgi:tight adherence protein C